MDFSNPPTVKNHNEVLRCFTILGGSWFNHFLHFKVHANVNIWFKSILWTSHVDMNSSKCCILSQLTAVPISLSCADEVWAEIKLKCQTSRLLQSVRLYHTVVCLVLIWGDLHQLDLPPLDFVLYQANARSPETVKCCIMKFQSWACVSTVKRFGVSARHLMHKICKLEKCLLKSKLIN